MKREELEPGDVFFYNSEYMVAAAGGVAFSLTNNDVRFVHGKKFVEKVKGVIQITHDVQKDGDE